MWRSYSTQGQSTASPCRLTSPKGQCSRMSSKVSSDWLPSYIKATRPVLEILKMAEYIPDSPRIHIHKTAFGYVSRYNVCRIFKSENFTSRTQWLELIYLDISVEQQRRSVTCCVISIPLITRPMNKEEHDLLTPTTIYCPATTCFGLYVHLQEVLLWKLQRSKPLRTSRRDWELLLSTWSLVSAKTCGRLKI
jgi:hypothetical protein